MRNVTITLTEEEAKELASLLTIKVATIGWQAVAPVFNGQLVSDERRAELDEAFAFWSEISKKVTKSFGFEAWVQPSAYAQEATDFEVEKAVLELQPHPPYLIVGQA